MTIPVANTTTQENNTKSVSPSYSPKIAHCEGSARLLSGTRVAAIASKDGDAAAL
jgi:hypothetical protein